MTDKIKIFPRFGGVDLSAFFGALIVTPLLLSFGGMWLGAWMMMIGFGGNLIAFPLLALFFDLPAYLILGGPFFWMALNSFPNVVFWFKALLCAVAGWVANLGTYQLYSVGSVGIVGANGIGETFSRGFSDMGSQIAPLSGLVFGLLYCRLASWPGRHEPDGRTP